jgi:SIR2-like domain
MSSPATVSLLAEEQDWEIDEKVLRFLGQKLVVGRVSLFLGAGASSAFGLPNWDTLTENLCKQAVVVRDKNLNNEKQAETIFVNTFYRDRLRFARAVQQSLFPTGYEADKVVFADNPLLSAIGALVMSSTRGRTAGVVTFNFDDLLEKYLAMRGFVVESCVKLPSWQSSGDVEVLHQHGLLSSDLNTIPDAPIVFTSLDYDDIIGKTGNLWRQRIIGLLQSTTPIFLGLSGRDQNLTSMLKEASEQHASLNDRYWGVRIGFSGENYEKDTWKNRRVWPLEVTTPNAIPDAVFSICRFAADIRKSMTT